MVVKYRQGVTALHEGDGVVMWDEPERAGRWSKLSSGEQLEVMVCGMWLSCCLLRECGGWVWEERDTGWRFLTSSVSRASVRRAAL